MNQTRALDSRFSEFLNSAPHLWVRLCHADRCTPRTIQICSRQLVLCTGSCRPWKTVARSMLAHVA